MSENGQAQELFNSYITVNSVLFDEPVWVEFYNEKAQANTVQIKPVVEELKKVLSEDFIEEISKRMDSEGKLTFGDLNEIGIGTSIDLNSLDLTLEVRKEDKKLTEFIVSGRGRRGTTGTEISPSFVSGYFNFRGAGEVSGSNREDILVNDYKDSSSLSVEGVLNFGGLAFESQYLYLDNVNTKVNRWGRLYSRVVFDDVKRSTRYTLGDLSHSIRGFQEIVLGAGLGIHKEFSIRPAFFRSSFKKHRFYLDTDSIVEVLVNGNLVRKKTLPQGPVELSDFPFNSGENEVKIRITDKLGAVKELNFSDINDTRLLAVGMTDYSFNILYPRKEERLSVDIEESYVGSNPTFSGFFHVGAYKNLVVGVDLQYNEDRTLLGFESVYGNPKGVLKLNLAGSGDTETEKNGFGLRLEHESLFFKKGALSDFRVFTSFQHKSEEFSDFLLGPTNSKYRARASVGQNFKNSIRASLGVVKEWYYDDLKDQTYITSNFGWTAYKNFDFSSNIRVNLENGDDTTVLLSLNWHSPKNNQQLTSTYNPIDDTATAELVTFPWKGNQNFRTYVGGETNSAARKVTAGLDYFNQRFESRASHTASFIEAGGTTNITRVNFATGLAFAGTTVAFTKPIENAFALISLKGRPWGYSVPINKGLNSQRGEINGWGPAAITNLAAYYSDRARLDISNLPYGYALDKESFRFKPTYRSGVRIRAKVDGEVSIAGRAVFENGDAAEYITGALYKVKGGKKGELIQQVFTGEDGVFSVEKVEGRKYILSFEGEETDYKDVLISVGSTVGVFELEKDIVLKR